MYAFAYVYIPLIVFIFTFRIIANGVIHSENNHDTEQQRKFISPKINYLLFVFRNFNVLYMKWGLKWAGWGLMLFFNFYEILHVFYFVRCVKWIQYVWFDIFL